MLSYLTLTLILIFSTSDVYKAQKINHESEKKNYIKSEEKNMIWFKQTISNACDLYNILYAVYNDDAKNFICKTDVFFS